MPDDDIEEKPATDQGYDTGTPDPSFAPDHDADTPQPSPGSDDKVIKPDEIRAQHDEINRALHSVLEQSRSNRNDEAQFTKELQDLKAEADKAPPAPPIPTAVPAPPDQQQKNTISVLATNVLKWGALVGLAYGLTRRSPNRSAMFTVALGAALHGYYTGNNEQRDRSLSVWEKNRQAIQDQNRYQHQQYEETLSNNKLSLQQKMDVLREQSTLWQNKRMQDGAMRQDVVAIQNAMDKEIKLERDFEEHTRRDRAEWYKLIGLSGKDGEEYREWIQEQGGPDISKEDDPDKMHAIESRYPIYKMLDEHAKEKRAQDVETAKQKAEGEMRGRHGEKQRETDQEKEDKITGHQQQKNEQGDKYDPHNPFGLNLGN